MPGLRVVVGMPDAEFDGIDAALGVVARAARKDAVAFAIRATALAWNEVVCGCLDEGNVGVAIEASAGILDH